LLSNNIQSASSISKAPEKRNANDEQQHDQWQMMRAKQLVAKLRNQSIGHSQRMRFRDVRKTGYQSQGE
jgi:hypothetical protein